MSEIAVRRRAGVGRVVIERPSAGNALTGAMWRALIASLEELSAEPGVRVLEIAGEGGLFSAGSDLRELAALPAEEVDRDLDLVAAVARRVEALPVPVVALIDGPCLGAALVLALACDLRIATERASFGLPLARLGLRPSPAFVRRLARAVGPGTAVRLVLTSETVGAREAWRVGLVHEVLPDAEALERRAQALAAALGEAGREVVAASKEVLYGPLGGGPEESGWRYVADLEGFRERCRAALVPHRGEGTASGQERR